MLRASTTQGGTVATVLIEDIRMDGEAAETQLREATDPDTVTRYAEALAREERFPAVELLPTGDGRTYYIADGWHRTLAHVEADCGTIEAIILVVPAGASPLEVAKRYALRANTRHGRQLTRGDMAKRARVALLMPCYRRYSLRQLEREIGVSFATIGRVKRKMIEAGELPWSVTGEPAPDWLPPEYISERVSNDVFGGDEELKTEVFRIINRLEAQNPSAWEFVYCEGDGHDPYGEHVILHRGLTRGVTVVIPVDDNSVVDGKPARSWVENDADGADEHGGRTLTKAERDKLEEQKARRRFFEARDRLMAYPDKELQRAVRALTKYREMPNLWRDLAILVAAGGPAEEHPFQDEDPDAMF